MAGWWSRNLSKKKHKEYKEDEKSGSVNFNCMKSSTRKVKKKGKVKDKANNSDELLPYAQRVFQYGYVSSTTTSGSSASSSASFDDHPTSPHFHFPNRRQGSEMKFNLKSKSNVGSRGHTSNPAATSPLHQRMNLFSFDTAQDHGRSQSQDQCHPLPLPPPPPPQPSLPPFNTPLSKNITNNLSKWQKGKLLGRGTFGHVYLGLNRETGQMCAVKEVKLVLDDQTSKECLKQLNQEINLLNQLSHPNIVQYYGSELSKEVLSVYLEYVSGGSIHKLLQEYGPFSEPVIQIYTRQIVSGLAYLHGRKTVHRDIKGANILVDPSGEIKLADFGMAKHINSSASMLSFKGSPHWMAPEVITNKNGYSLPVDIWSLGCTILEMATGRPPWSEFEGVAAIFKIGSNKDMPEIPKHLSSDAKNFIKLCLHRNPLARPTAQKLLDHPFIREQSATKASNVGITRDSFPYMLDGSRTPWPVLRPHSNRTSMISHDRDYATFPALAASRGSNNPRDNTRMNTSLPVSPSSSPLREYRPAQKNCFLSPTHPNYTTTRQTNHVSFPVRLNATSTLDPRHETSLYRNQTPYGGSPRTRLI